MQADWKNAGFGLYLHWPFCAAKCPYCDFNSHVSAQIDTDTWQAAYLQQIDHWAELTPNRRLNTVFFGGGTPSLMPVSLVDAIMDRIRARWSLANDFEATLEANPTSVDAKKFAGFNMAGINRISLGIQALNDKDLRALGRLHSAKEAMQAFDVARTAFERVSFDLIYARQNQTLEAWQSELKNALEMAIDHLSLYQLTVEPNTAFGKRYEIGKLTGLPSDDRAADMYETTAQICGDYGFHGYEVSNYAKAGAASLHNLIYWRYGDYIGIGPGAHGRVSFDNKRLATQSTSAPKQWLEQTSRAVFCDQQILSPQDQAQEYLMMSMRLDEGCNIDRLAQLNGRAIHAPIIQSMVEIGMAFVEDGQLRATHNGRMVLNSLIAKLYEALEV